MNEFSICLHTRHIPTALFNKHCTTDQNGDNCREHFTTEHIHLVPNTIIIKYANILDTFRMVKDSSHATNRYSGHNRDLQTTTVLFTLNFSNKAGFLLTVACLVLPFCIVIKVLEVEHSGTRLLDNSCAITLLLLVHVFDVFVSCVLCPHCLLLRFRYLSLSHL